MLRDAGGMFPRRPVRTASAATSGAPGRAPYPGHRRVAAEAAPTGDARGRAHLASLRPMRIVLTPFARARLFPREARPNTIQDCSPEEFERRLNEEPPLK